MQVGKPNASLAFRVDSLDARSASFDQTAKRVAMANAGAQLAQDNQRILTQGLRTDMLHQARQPVYRQIGSEISSLRTRIGDLGAVLASLFQTPAPTAISSDVALNLGDGRRVQSVISATQTTTVQPPTPAPEEQALDPNAKLNTQPFETAITAGTVKVQFKVNGSTSSATVNINPATQSLNDVLDAFNNLKVGTVKPLTATFDADAGTINFQVNSNSGKNFDFTITGGTSNFAAVIGTDGLDTTRAVTVNAAIDNKPNRTNYYKLTINVEGQGAVTLSNLSVSSGALSLDQKVDELVAQINVGAASLGVTAVNAGGGKLGFTTSNQDLAGLPDLGIKITQASRSGAIKLGLQSGYTTVAGFSADPNLKETTPVAPPPVTTTTTASRPVDINVGGALGPDASLRDLASQLGLQSRNGQYTVDINGQSLSFNENQSLNEVLGAISSSGAGVRASYDRDTHRVTLTSLDGRPLTARDSVGNLVSRLGLGDFPNVNLANDAEQRVAQLAGELNDLQSLITNNIQRGTGLEGDRLLNDLAAAIGGLFTPSIDGGLRALGDLGVTQLDGQIQIDSARFQAVLAQSPNAVADFFGTFIGERVDPLLSLGQRAVTDAPSVDNAEARSASQTVRLQGEVARLQVRQQLLTLQKQRYDDMRTQVENQREALHSLAQDLRDRFATGLQEDIEQASRIAERLGQRHSLSSPPAPVLPPLSAAPLPASGLLSFGLATENTA